MRPLRRRRGTVITYFLVLVSVLTTGLLTTMALTAGDGAQVAGITLKRDQAFYAAEAGVQQAFWRLKANNDWRAPSDTPLTGTVGSATYAVTVIGDWNSPVLITSVGRMGTGAGASAITVTAACSPTTIVPAISLGNNFDNNGNVTINGDVQAKGNINTTGRFRENGSLYAGGSITANGSVDITGTSAPNTPNITIPTVDLAWLKSHATQTVNVPSGSKTYEVASVNLGQGGIIYYTGSVQFKGDVTVTGYGTVVVNGDVTIQGAASFGSSSQPAKANIVTAGALDVSGYLGLIGSVYTGGTITKNGGLDVTGVIVGQVDLDTSGGMTITRAQPPSWDPRSSSGGSGTMVLSRVTGPIF
jgi:hypothetical protein